MAQNESAAQLAELIEINRKQAKELTTIRRGIVSIVIFNVGLLMLTFLQAASIASLT